MAKEKSFAFIFEGSRYMAEKKDSVKEITEKLEQGLKELFDSERYKTYLNTMSKFHNYSFNNTLLIAMQKPDATLVAGFNSWQKNFDRHVNKGEKGIRIMAPAPYKKKQEVDVIDKNTGKPVIGEDGKPKTEQVEIVIPAFKPVTVFDVSQTTGKDIPSLGADELKFTVENFEDFIKALERVSPVPMEYMDISSEAKGYFSPSEQRIVIQNDMGESQTVKTAVHEIAHSLLHDKDNVRVEGIEEGEKKSRSTKEVEAESVAYTVCQHFGIDTSEYSFAYVAGWSSGKEMPELKESMDTIRKTASQLITGIENELREIQLQRSQTMEKAQEPVTLVVAECCEYHALGEHYEGVKSVDEAIRLFQAIPSESLNGIKSIGLDVPRVDKEFSMEIDVLVGQTFDLDTLNFVPGVKENKQAMEMIARLIDHYPEMEIRGEIPPLCAEILSQIREERTLLEELSPSMALAIKIDEFMHDFDPYAYADQVTDREAQVKTISDDLEKGEAGYMVSYFKELISNEDGLMEDRQKAQQFIKEIEEYKPLAKIEEQLEENYNHIDNYLNNLKKPSEERIENSRETEEKQEEALNQADSDSGRKTDVDKQIKTGKRPSLRKRLEEKKAQVASVPEKPANEKEHVKNNERSITDG